MNKLIIRLLKLAVVIIILYSLFFENNLFPISFRWVVFSITIYIGFIKRKEDGLISTLIYGFFSILFNPFYEFKFGRTIWVIISFIVVLFLIVTIHWKEYEQSLTQKGKAIYHLVRQCVYGILALIGAGILVSSMVGGNPYHQYLLKTEGVTTQGYITYIKESVGERDDGGESYSYDYWYYFHLPNDKEIDCHQSIIFPIGHDIPYVKHTPIKAAVVYLKSDPQINRLKLTLPATNSEFLWRIVIGGIFFLIIFGLIGYLIIRNAIKDYISEINEIKRL